MESVGSRTPTAGASTVPSTNTPTSLPNVDQWQQQVISAFTTALNASFGNSQNSQDAQRSASEPPAAASECKEVESSELQQTASQGFGLSIIEFEEILNQQMPKIINKTVDLCLNKFATKLKNELQIALPSVNDFIELHNSQTLVKSQVAELQESIHEINNKFSDSNIKTLTNITEDLVQLDKIPSILTDLANIKESMVTTHDLIETESTICERMQLLMPKKQIMRSKTPDTSNVTDYYNYSHSQDFDTCNTLDASRCVTTTTTTPEQEESATLAIGPTTSTTHVLASHSMVSDGITEYCQNDFCSPQQNTHTNNKIDEEWHPVPLNPNINCPHTPSTLIAKGDSENENHINEEHARDDEMDGVMDEINEINETDVFENEEHEHERVSENNEQMDESDDATIDESVHAGASETVNETASATASVSDTHSVGNETNLRCLILKNQRLLERLTDEISEMRCKLEENGSNISSLESEILNERCNNADKASEIENHVLDTMENISKKMDEQFLVVRKNIVKAYNKLSDSINSTSDEIIGEIKIISEENGCHKEEITELIEKQNELLKEHCETTTNDVDSVCNLISHIVSEVDASLNTLFGEKVSELSEKINKSEKYLTEEQKLQFQALQDVIKDQNVNYICKMDVMTNDLTNLTNTNVKSLIELVKNGFKQISNKNMENLLVKYLKSNFENVGIQFQEIKESMQKCSKIEKLSIDRMSIFNQFATSMSDHICSIQQSIENLNQKFVLLKTNVKSDEIAYCQLMRQIETTCELPNIIEKQSDSIQMLHKAVCTLNDKSNNFIKSKYEKQDANLIKLDNVEKELCVSSPVTVSLINSDRARCNLSECEMKTLNSTLDVKLNELQGVCESVSTQTLLKLDEKLFEFYENISELLNKMCLQVSMQNDAEIAKSEDDVAVTSLNLNLQPMEVSNKKQIVEMTQKLERMLLDVMAQLKKVDISVNSVQNINNLVNGNDFNEFVTKDDLLMFHQSLIENLMEIANGNDLMIGDLLVHNRIRSLIDDNNSMRISYSSNCDEHKDENLNQNKSEKIKHNWIANICCQNYNPILARATVLILIIALVVGFAASKSFFSKIKI